jgi:hypothetical protein
MDAIQLSPVEGKVAHQVESGAGATRVASKGDLTDVLKQRRMVTRSPGLPPGPRPPAPICVAGLHYARHDAIKADIANFEAALHADCL